jgi:predicted ribosomally synthesized peptide with nif11-like leader
MAIKNLQIREDFAMPINKNEITKEMLEKAMQCNTAEDLIAYAKTEGVDLTKEEAEAYLDELSECELKDGDLKHVAGGASDTHECGDLKAPY